jgi:uncharacterized membrane protein
MWRSQAFPAALVGSCVAMSAALWSRVPDRMPVHWNAAGEVDRYGSRLEGLLVLPALAVGIWALMTALPSLDRTGNLDNSRPALNAIRDATLAMLCVLHAAMLAIAVGSPVNMPQWVGVAVGVELMVIGNVLGKLRPNGLAGVRTPWTLTSLRSWNTTHRVGGWLYVGVGGIAAVTSAFVPTVGVMVLVGGVLAATAAMVGVSWWVWRSDPDRTPFGGVTPG